MIDDIIQPGPPLPNSHVPSPEVVSKSYAVVALQRGVPLQMSGAGNPDVPGSVFPVPRTGCRLQGDWWPGVGLCRSAKCGSVSGVGRLGAGNMAP